MEFVDLPICCLRRIAAHCDIESVMNLQRTCRDSGVLFALNIDMQAFICIRALNEVAACYMERGKAFRKARRRAAHWQLWTNRFVAAINQEDIAQAEGILAESD